jgi:predicted regulator of Ras-like GTPase activity (Roadblock/LC7/MglB family)
VSITSVLSAMRDIPGVLGSFLIDRDGVVLARDLPPSFDATALTHASSHLSRLRAALESVGAGFESSVTRFGPHLVLLRAQDSNTLCVLCPHGTNLPAVQMSATLITRRLLESTPSADALLDSGDDARASASELDAGAAASTSTPARRFRGRTL